MARLRSFLAVELPSHTLSQIDRVQEDLRACRADVRWVAVERIHLTLKFLGNIDEEHIEGISSAMADAAARRETFMLSVRGLGTFPSIRNPRIIWLGLDGWEENLLPLQNDLESRLEALGFQREEKPYRPHLTLGRVKSLKGREDLVDLMERDRDIDLGSFPVGRITLFRSDLRPSGPVYTPLAVRELAGG